ncbi:MAG TPA: hypothetical protein VNI02_18405 [Blastocatellia bacterium]|nr:hypothetical protein [Blastocatellia bacterium]
MRRTIIITTLFLASALASPLPPRAAGLSSEAPGDAAPVFTSAEAQTPQCPVVIPDSAVVVAPNQPEVEPRSTVGIINALCDVTLDFVQCGFTPTAINITCDTNGDGVPELMIPLKNITVVNSLLVQATLPALSPQLPGSPFPLACCGGRASLILSRHIGSGDDNVFGPFTQTQTCEIDLGVRAPVVISVSPAEGDCSLSQNLLLPGACYTLADGKPNVTSVFAVDRDNPATVIQATRFVILNSNLIDAHFDFGAASAGRTFLIFAGGPNGTSRNLTSLPAGAPAGCPLGNEQGVAVTLTCKSRPATGGAPAEPSTPSDLASCRLERNPDGSFTLELSGVNFTKEMSVTVGGMSARKIKFKDPDPSNPRVFRRVILKGRICQMLPGPIAVISPDGSSARSFFCGARCSD